MPPRRDDPWAARLSVCALVLWSCSLLAGKPVIEAVSVSPAFFSPTLGQKASIRFSLTAPGKVTVSILDRDRFVVRTLPPVDAKPGPVSVIWDGTDGKDVLPNEAYTVKIEFAGAVRETYDPTEGFVPVIEEPTTGTYSTAEGVLSYRLSRPSRVHVQAGQAKLDPKTKRPQGPVLRSLVDREPRVAGQIVEAWDSFDESGTFSVSNLPHFMVGVFAASLPESTVITVGNEKQTFRDYARTHRPKEALVPRPLPATTHTHHSGLNVFEDGGQKLRLKLPGTPDPTLRAWRASGSLSFTAELDAESAPYFVSQPTTIYVYLNEKQIKKIEKPQHPAVITVDTSTLPIGEHRLSVNWASSHGPTTVSAARIFVERKPTQEAHR